MHEANDNTNDDDERGTLVAFISVDKADRLLALPAAERQEIILSVLAKYYGDQALTPVLYVESDRVSEEWTSGAYGVRFVLGGQSRYGALLLERVGPIRFASSDLAAEGFQHVDGAIRFGHRIAAPSSRLRPDDVPVAVWPRTGSVALVECVPGRLAATIDRAQTGCPMTHVQIPLCRIPVEWQQLRSIALRGCPTTVC